MRLRRYLAIACVSTFLLFDFAHPSNTSSYASDALMMRQYNPNGDSVNDKVINGSPVDPNEWKATLILEYSGQRCTASIVGKFVILTAAHCVEHGKQGKLRLSGGKILRLVCSWYDLIEHRATADFALCLVRDDIYRKDANIKYESIYPYFAILRPQRKVRLLGFGCTALNDSGFGKLNEGIARIIRLPRRSLYFFAQGPSALCAGDSGSAAYMYISKDKKKRAIVGIGALGNSVLRISAFSAIGTRPFVKWAKEWADTYGVRICGLHADAERCRNDEVAVE